MRGFALTALVLLLAPLAARADEFTLPPIPAEYRGTWIPQGFAESFQRTLNYAESLRAAPPSGKAHDILLVEERRIGANLGFHDSYAITADEFRGFTLTKAAGLPGIVDGKGNAYLRISAEVGPAGYEAFRAWLAAAIKRRVDDPTPHPGLRIEGSRFAILDSQPARSYELLLDLFPLHRGGRDPAAYDFYLYDRERAALLGLRFAGEAIEAWRVITTITLRGGAIADERIAEVLAYYLLRD